MTPSLTRLSPASRQRTILRDLFTSYTANDPQQLVQIDREKAKAIGVPHQPGDAGAGRLHGLAVRERLRLQQSLVSRLCAGRPAVPHERARPAAILCALRHQRSGAARIISCRLKDTSGPQVINHFNLFRSAEIDGAAAPGYSSGQGLKAMEDLAKQNMLQGMSFSWSGLALEEVEAGGKAIIIFGLGLLVVYLTLSAQYESFALPFIILLAVPMAVLGALIFISMRGLVDDVYVQIGLVLLIGLSAKNSILIVEFAEQLIERGRSIIDAAIEAAELRLRPILMTSFAFILGVLPLYFASGAGKLGGTQWAPRSSAACCSPPC